MRRLRKLTLIVCILALAYALVSTVKVQASVDEMKTFFDSQIPGITIQVNATTQTLPTENLTVAVSLETQTDVGVEHFNLEVSGFLNGTIKLSMLNITGNNFYLNSTSAKEYVNSTYVPSSVWGITYGEISLSYNASVEGLVLTFPNIVSGFPMTQVENTFLEGLETQNTILQEQVKSLNDSYEQLTSLYQNLSNTFEQLNQTYVELYQNYTSVQGSLGDLDNTRRVTTVLAVTTIIFFVTTIYLVMRRPRESW
jgi:predicted PurR-regulated permease PerM